MRKGVDFKSSYLSQLDLNEKLKADKAINRLKLLPYLENLNP